MKLLGSLTIHSTVLVAATGFALAVWNRADSKPTDSEATVEVWPGSAEAVEQVSYEKDKTKVRIERRQDDAGRYYLVEVDKTEPTPTKAAESNPDDPDADAEAEAAAPATGGHKIVRLVAVDSASTLVDLLAPLKALRAIGRIGPGRITEFGFDKPEGKLSVKISGTSRELVIGGMTPGGADHYVKLGGSGEVYAISGQIVRMLSYAESRLVERELHKFEPGQLKRVRIASASGSRELVELGGEGWARAASPTVKDETAGNWMTKLNGLSVTEYVEKLPAGAEPVLHVDYLGSAGRIGYLDLSKVKEPNAKAPKYFARSERTRWYGQVLQSSADQVEQDLPTVMR